MDCNDNINADFFIEVYSRLCGSDRVPFLNPRTIDEKVSCIQAFRDDIENIVDVSLSHISPEAVVEHDGSAVCDLLEVVTALVAVQKPFVSKQPVKKSPIFSQKLLHDSPELPRSSARCPVQLNTTTSAPICPPPITCGKDGLSEDISPAATPSCLAKPLIPLIKENASSPPSASQDSGLCTGRGNHFPDIPLNEAYAFPVEQVPEDNDTDISSYLDVDDCSLENEDGPFDAVKSVIFGGEFEPLETRGNLSILSERVREAEALAQMVHEQALAVQQHVQVSNSSSERHSVDRSDHLLLPATAFHEVRQSLVQLTTSIQSALVNIDRVVAGQRPFPPSPAPPPAAAANQSWNSLPDVSQSTASSRLPQLSLDLLQLDRECAALLDAKTRCMKDSLRLCARRLSKSSTTKALRFSLP